MKKKVIIMLSIIFLIFLFLLTAIILKVSYSYNDEELKENDILIGNDIYSGYISPNDIVNSALKYYIETQDKEGLKTFKVKNKELNKVDWEYLVDDFKYEKLNNDEINKLEIRRLTNNIKKKLNSLSEEELEKYSILNDENTYYFFITDLFNINISTTRNTYGYIVYKDNLIKNYNINLNNKYYTDSNDKSDLKIVNVNDYGAKENDNKDDTKEIKQAVAKLKELQTGILYFEKGIYNVSVGEEFNDLLDAFNNPQNPEYERYKNYTEELKQYYLYWTIQGKSINNEITNTIIDLSDVEKKTIIELNNSEIKLTQNSMATYNIINITNSKNIVIRNGKITGDRVKHDYKDHLETIGKYSEYLKSHAWGYGIKFSETSGTIENMVINNLTGDGIFIADRNSPNLSTTNLNNIEVYKNRRMGITIEETDKVIANNLYIHEIGEFDGIAGILPKSGIDIETEVSGKPTNYVSLNNSIIENCTNYTIVSSARQIKDDNDNVIEVNPFVKELVLTNTKLDGKTTFYNGKINYSTIEMNSLGTTTLNSTYINNSNIYLNENNTWINFKNSNVENTDIKGSYSDTTGNYLRYSNSTFRNCTISDFQGYNEKYGKNNFTYTGIQITSDTENTFNSNKFYNNNFVIGTTKDTNYKFIDSEYNNNTFIFNRYNSNYQKTLEIDNSIFTNNVLNSPNEEYQKLTEININNSKISESNFEQFHNKISNSIININDINSIFYKYGADIDSSSLNIKGNILNNKVLSNINFKNNSKVIIKNYNSQVKIYNPNSVLGQDYTIEYEGTKEISE